MNSQQPTSDQMRHADALGINVMQMSKDEADEAIESKIRRTIVEKMVQAAAQRREEMKARKFRRQERFIVWAPRIVLGAFLLGQLIYEIFEYLA